jgi:hypothetical protein
MAQFKFATALDGGLIIVNIDDIRTLEVVGGGHTKISFDKDHYVTIKETANDFFESRAREM